MSISEPLNPINEHTTETPPIDVPRIGIDLSGTNDSSQNELYFKQLHDYFNDPDNSQISEVDRLKKVVDRAVEILLIPDALGDQSKEFKLPDNPEDIKKLKQGYLQQFAEAYGVDLKDYLNELEANSALKSTNGIAGSLATGQVVEFDPSIHVEQPQFPSEPSSN